MLQLVKQQAALHVTSEIRLCQSMRIYLKNNLAKIHPYPIWNDEAVDFFEERRANKNTKNNKNDNKMSSDMGLVHDPKKINKKPPKWL